jgi:hypothetical protein
MYGGDSASFEWFKPSQDVGRVNNLRLMEDYDFLKKEFNRLIELDPTIEFPYWIRLHSTAEHLISQI